MVSLDGYEDWATGCNGDGQGQTSATECAFCLVDFSLKSPNGVLVLAVLLVEDLDEMLYEGTTSQGRDTHSAEDNWSDQAWDDRRLGGRACEMGAKTNRWLDGRVYER